MPKDLPSPKLLRKLLRYELDTGKLFWLPRGRDFFEKRLPVPYWTHTRWNAKFAGKEAFTAVTGHGYKQGKLMGVCIKAHRAIWAISYGEWPQFIDHINGNRLDNRLQNLRMATSSQNSRNRCVAQNNTSGVPGVVWNKKHLCWHARIRTGGKTIHLGSFANKAEAVVARKKAEKENGYHPNHGRVIIKHLEEVQ